MRKIMPEFYDLDDGQKRELLSNAVLVLDGSALLGLYRLNTADRLAVLDMLEMLRQRLWVPRAAAEEYHLKRVSVVHSQLAAYDELARRVAVMREDLMAALESHPVLSQARIKLDVQDRLVSLENFLIEQKRNHHPEDLSDPMHHDGVLDKLTILLGEEQVGAQEATEEHLQSARTRRNEAVPPGIAESESSIRDVLAWQETLATWGKNDKATTGGLIWVTEREQSNWWRTERGVALGPRPELVREARAVEIAPFWLVDVQGFYSFVQQAYKWDRPLAGQYGRSAGSRHVVSAPALAERLPSDAG
jgi:hypothetical protein